MSDFGFDPSLILNAQGGFGRAFDSGIGTAKSLSDLYQTGLQRQLQQGQVATQQANLSQLLYNQQRQKQLAGIFSQNAGAFQDPYAHALAQGGFGQEAQAAQQAGLERQMMAQKFLGTMADLTASRLGAAKTGDDVDKVMANTPQMVLDTWGHPGKDATDADKLKWKDSFIKARLTPEQQAENANKEKVADNGRFDFPRNEFGQMFIADKRRGTLTPAGGASPAQAMGMDGSLDAAARQYNTTGEIPDLGRDPGGLLHRAIINRAHELDPSANIPANKAAYKADSASLEHAQGQADAVNGFTRTFDKNVGILQDALGKLNSSNNPLANKALRYLQEHGSGDPNFTAFNNALNTVRSELGKINSGSTGQGGVPISLLQEMETGLPADATPKQVFSALKVYRQDSENRRSAMQEQIDEIKGRMGGKSAKRPASGAGAPPGITHVRTVNGETRGWNGKAWVPLPGDALSGIAKGQDDALNAVNPALFGGR